MANKRTERPRRYPFGWCAASALLLWGMATTTWSQEIEATEPDPPADSATVAAYRTLVTELEQVTGTYSEDLPEQLLSLGLALQQQGRHEEAVEVFKRGIHLSRINQGLHNAEQIPLVRGEITSQMARGEWESADERQAYLFRVQRRAMTGLEDMSPIFMQHARWQYDAYRLAVDSDGFVRLLSMWDYYRMAATEISERQGPTSPELLEPLQGLLRTQYLIANHEIRQAEASSQNDFSRQSQYGRFASIQARGYQQGRAVIRAMYDVYVESDADDDPRTLEALVMLGDWMWFNGEKAAATEAYREAITELDGVDDAQVTAEAVFGQPVPLPDVDGIRPLPLPGEHSEDRALLQYAVNENGRVTDLELLEGDEELARQLMRSLRRTRFRPRFEQLEPVETEDIQSSYAY